MIVDPSEIVIDKAMRLIARMLAAGRVRSVVSGLEHLPSHGPALIVARHYHHLFDGLMLFAGLPRRFHIVVTLDWARDKRSKLFFASLNRLARWPMLLRADALRHLSVNEENLFNESDLLRYQRQAVRQSIALLVEGRMLVIFPEGYPNIDPAYTPKTQPNEFLPFKPGFVTILSAAEKRLKQQIPIVPAGLHYVPGKPWIGHLRFGAPLRRDPRASNAALISALERTVKQLSQF